MESEITNDILIANLNFIWKYKLYGYIAEKLCNYSGDMNFKLFDDTYDRNIIFYNNDDVFILACKYDHKYKDTHLISFNNKFIHNDIENNQSFFNNHIYHITFSKMIKERGNMSKEDDLALYDRIYNIKKNLRGEENKIVSILFHNYIYSINLLYLHYNGNVEEIFKHIHAYILKESDDCIVTAKLHNILKPSEYQSFIYEDKEFSCYDKYELLPINKFKEWKDEMVSDLIA